MGQTRTDHDVLRSIEQELREDHEIWRTIERQLHDLRGGPAPAPEPTRETRIAWAVIIAMFVVAAFGLGWMLSEQAQEAAAPVVVVAPVYGEDANTTTREAMAVAALPGPMRFPIGLENPGVTAAERDQVAQNLALRYPGQGGKG